MSDKSEAAGPTTTHLVSIGYEETLEIRNSATTLSTLTLMVHTSSEFKDLRITGVKLLNPGCQLRRIYFAVRDAAGAA